jgi:hypothetical protein
MACLIELAAATYLPSWPERTSAVPVPHPICCWGFGLMEEVGAKAPKAKKPSGRHPLGSRTRAKGYDAKSGWSKLKASEIHMTPEVTFAQQFFPFPPQIVVP